VVISASAGAGEAGGLDDLGQASAPNARASMPAVTSQPTSSRREDTPGPREDTPEPREAAEVSRAPQRPQ
jgi:hypothetical protein